MTDQIELIPGTNRDVSLSQWFTPPELAQRVVEWCYPQRSGRILAGLRVLEPSAGNGALVRPLVAAGALVTAFDIDERYQHDLQAVMRGKPGQWGICDFLELTPVVPYDLCVMNPPYENGLDVAFILHALKFAPRVVGVFRSQILHGVERKEQLWKEVRPTRVAFCSRRPFKGAETDYVVLELVARPNPRIVLNEVSLEWWL